MSKRNFFIMALPLIVCVLCFCSVKAQNANSWPNPKIKIGISKVSGDILNYQHGRERKITVTLIIGDYFNLVERNKDYSTQVDSDNHFSLSVPVSFNKTMAYCVVGNDSSFLWKGFIGLDEEQETKIEVDVKDINNPVVTASGGFSLSQDDAQGIYKGFDTFDDFPQERVVPVYKMTPKKFATYKLNHVLKDRINYALKNLSITPGTKDFMIKYFNFRYIDGKLFFYKEEVENDAKHHQKAIKAIEPNKTYYSFLKNYDLNDPQLLYWHPHFMERFLKIKAFNIPKIADTPTSEWINVVKDRVKDVIGISNGPFYDMLAAFAYSSQITDDGTVLTNKQIENIKEYFKNRNNDIAILLLNLNEKHPKPDISEPTNNLENANAINHHGKAPRKVRCIIKPTLNVSVDKIIDTIVAKHHGKVVLIDIWATWCNPCMMAHKEMSYIKDALRHKGVDFVYLADASSPKQEWREDIKSIGDEHYYIDRKIMDKLMAFYKTDGFPSYFIYDKQGMLKNKFIGFPGDDKMQSLLEDVLKQ